MGPSLLDVFSSNNENGIMSHKNLLTPGPVPCSPKILETLSQPIIHHRTPEFEEIFQNVAQNLKKVFQTEQPVLTLCSTGSGAMEAAIVNTLSPKEQVIVIESGKFGQRWSQICQAYGVEVIPYAVSWGESAEIEKIKSLLKENPQCRAVITQACETSTGAIHPIKDIGQILQHQYQSTLFIVDGITAVGAYDLPFDKWGIDVLIAGSQKAFMLPTGLSFICLSEKAWQASRKSSCPKFYWDLEAEFKSYKKRQTHFSSPVTLIRSLHSALQELLTPSLKQHLNKVSLRAQCVRQGLLEMGFKIFPLHPSPSLTAVELPEGSIDSQTVRSQLEQIHDMTTMGGQDQLKGKILRIGHMGYITKKNYELLFIALQKTIPSITENQLEKSLLTLKPLSQYE